MKLEDLGLKVKKMGERKFKRRSSIPVRTPVLDTGKASVRNREYKWDLIKKDEQLQQIRLRKLEKMVKAQVEEKEKKQIDDRSRQIYTVWRKVDWVMRTLIEPEAYQFLEMIRKTEPAVYKEMFKLLVDKPTIGAIDSIIERIRKFGVKDGKKMTKQTIMKYYRNVKGINPKIMVDRGGIRKAVFSK